MSSQVHLNIYQDFPWLMGKLFQFFGLASWWVQSRLGRKRPLVNTMIIHYACNLRCRHCSLVGNEALLPPKQSLSAQELEEEMRAMRKAGARILYFEGGEPTLWSDDGKDLGDMIELGRSMGYFNIGYTTNGTNRFYTGSDVISISLDGTKEVHDSIRGEGVFDTLMKNLEELNHPSVFANFVIQKSNLHVIRETAELVRDNPSIKGIIYNFITPPPYEEVPTWEEKKKAVDEIIQMKKDKLPILNSKRALKLLLEEDFADKCPYFVSAFVLPDGSHAHGCPMEGTESCHNCGFDAVREYYLVNRGNPFTILEMTRMFALSK